MTRTMGTANKPAFLPFHPDHIGGSSTPLQLPKGKGQAAQNAKAAFYK